MISNPKHGWCNFKLGTFKGIPSYLTNVPADLLTAFIDYHTKGYGIAWFDEEGTEFSFILTPYSLFIIEEKEKPVLHDFSEMKIKNLEKELVKDIEKDLNRWAEFITNEDCSDKIIQHRKGILQKLSILKKYIK
ncbi:MAG: hypothetical protein K1W19_07640 [Lachnospiraceae bacterium]